MNFESMNVINFRDLGKVKTINNLYVKENLIYRGGAFNNVDDMDKMIIDNIAFKHIFDLRSIQELERDKFYYLPDNCIYHNYADVIREKLQVDLDVLNGLNKDKFYTWLVDLYCELPFNNIAYKEIFECIKRKEFPIYFHCSAGKDRTGVLAALILNMLGVERKEIIDEYLLSLPNLIRMIEAYDEDDIKFVNEYWIEEMFKTLDKKYPNNDDYYLKEYGIDENIKNEIKTFCLEK